MTSQTSPQATGGVADSRNTFKVSQHLRQLSAYYKILTLLITMAAIWLLFSMLVNGVFTSPHNLSNLLRQVSITGMLAYGMVFVIIADEIDLSVGSLLGLLGGVAAILDQGLGWSITATVPIVLLLGVAMGLPSGWWSTYRGVPSFIAGLGGMPAYHGILLGLTYGSTITPVSDSFVLIGQGYLSRRVGDLMAVLIFCLLIFVVIRQRHEYHRYEFGVASLRQGVAKLVVAGAVIVVFVATLNSYGGIPVPVLLVLALLDIFSWIASQTVFGCRIYSVGLSPEATRLSDTNTDRVKLAIFGLMGLMCAFAGIVNTARLATGPPSAGTMGKPDAVAAYFIDGTSMRGDAGIVYGALAGALVMASLDNDMSIFDVDAYWQMIVKGSILVLAVWVDVISHSGCR